MITKQELEDFIIDHPECFGSGIYTKHSFVEAFDLDWDLIKTGEKRERRGTFYCTKKGIVSERELEHFIINDPFWLNKGFSTANLFVEHFKLSKKKIKAGKILVDELTQRHYDQEHGQYYC